MFPKLEEEDMDGWRGVGMREAIFSLGAVERCDYGYGYGWRFSE